MRSKNKEELEVEKLELEIQQLRKPWFKKPQVFLSAAAVLAALVGVVGENIRSEIKAERTLLKAERAEATAEKAQERARAALSLEERVKQSIKKLQKEYEQLSNRHAQLTAAANELVLADSATEKPEATDLEPSNSQAIVARAIDKHGESWSFVGTFRNGRYIKSYFETVDIPKVGEEVLATANVNRRADKPRLIQAWKLARVVGAIQKGERLQVTEVARIPAKGGGTQDWVKGKLVQ